MTTILTSRDNLAFIKKALRSALPDISSSHLSEALATGLGFKTHAALLAATGNNAPPLLLRINPVRIAERLGQLAHQGVEADFVADMARSPQLPERIFVEFRNGDRASNDPWFYECRRRNIPMVYIETRRKFVKLRWDCITIDNRNEAHVQDKAGTQLVHAMFAKFQEMTRGASGKPWFEGKSFVGYVDRLSPEPARAMAEEFFAMLYVPMHESAKAA
jgi:hypothetical protein